MQTTKAHEKAIAHYYKELSGYDAHHVSHETAIRTAFHNLLVAFSHGTGWDLIPEQTLPGGIRPDGTFRDQFNLPRGYWEAKDSKDVLDAEIKKKIAAGYPTDNIIFEDSRRGMLYQHHRPVYEANLRDRTQLQALLVQFFTYVKPDIATFEAAVNDFKQHIPDLAQGLLERIRSEHTGNKAFTAAFADFLTLCRSSLDPHITHEAINEMLVQHLLTERLFRTIFNNADFTNRNIIAAEIERVIRALTSRSFNRGEFLKSLDRFYIAIEDAARSLQDWTEKQHFLNTVYERFFQGFSVKQADTHGIIYTPQEIVDFMCASVEALLQSEFGTSLSTPGVQILDPATGTGNFIVNLIQRTSGAALTHKYAHDLFCNEIMLLPYYIASLNIEHAYYERTGLYQPFDGICFADTLNLESKQMSFFSERNTARIQQEKDAPIMVIIGNPPYNVGQRSENDNNKNRRYPLLDQRVSQTYARDSQASNKNALSDVYVKFFRWATDRLQGRDGMVCFVSNNSFVSKLAFDGMRRHLRQDFTQIYHLDLGGDARSQGGGNVFGIMVGVGITVAVRFSAASERKLSYYRVPEFWRRSEKLTFLSEKKNITGISWQDLTPDAKHTWLTEGMHADFDTFLPMGTREAKTEKFAAITTIFKNYGNGLKTSRDSWAYDFHRSDLLAKMQRFIETYNSEVDRWRRRGTITTDLDDFVIYDDTQIKWSRDLKLDLQREQYARFSEDKVRTSLYRPFCKQWLFFDRILNEEVYQFPTIFPTPTSEAENKVIIVSDHGHRASFSTLVSDVIPDLHVLAAIDAFQCFPYYTYAEDGSNRRENITDWALFQFQGQYGPEVTKGDLFHYVYALLHHPQYRERYAENLKRDLPRIPLVAGQAGYETLVQTGKALMELHLGYEQAPEYPLTWQENHDLPVSWRVEKMRLLPGKEALVVNDWLTLSGIPPDCSQYRLGNRSALEWVIDQYQVSTDARSGIASDPNRAEDPQYIARLVGRVVQVSVETVRLVNGLSQAIPPESWLGAGG